jgi:general stress protein YciG
VSRGFAKMDPALVRELARKGGKRAHELGTAHQFTKDEARIAGASGGKAIRKPKPEAPVEEETKKEIA